VIEGPAGGPHNVSCGSGRSPARAPPDHPAAPSCTNGAAAATPQSRKALRRLTRFADALTLWPPKVACSTVGEGREGPPRHIHTCPVRLSLGRPVQLDLDQAVAELPLLQTGPLLAAPVIARPQAGRRGTDRRCRCARCARRRPCRTGSRRRPARSRSAADCRRAATAPERKPVSCGAGRLAATTIGAGDKAIS
jgi:hypothetical protein